MTGKLLLGLMLVSVGGCVPLAQAPLVYSSRQQMGVGVSAGTPDTPGLDLTLGYKGLDAAYIPVAVGRACQLQSNAATARQDNKTPVCSESDLRLWLVRGTHSWGSARGIGESTISDTRERIEGLEEEIAKLKRTSDSLEAARAKLAKIAMLSTPAPQSADGAAIPPMPSNVSIISGLQQEVVTLSGLPTPTDDLIASEINKITPQITKKELDLKDADVLLDRLLAAQSRRSTDVKTDALSVYGSFNGNASADSKSAGLSLGKVFSTGVAAQHITQGIHESAPILAGADCLARLTKLIEIADVAIKKTIGEQGIIICASARHEDD